MARLIPFFIFLLACGSTKPALDNTYVKEIEQHRTKTEEGITVGLRAPLQKKDLQHLRYFDLSSAYKVEAKVQLVEGSKPFEIPTYSGITKTFLKYATLHFKIENKALQLNVYRNLEVIRMPQYKNYLFLPYMDHTNGEQTYGGGRYINLSTLDIQNGTVILDFNKSYNPWCAYSDGYNCPIPPNENHLDIAIIAGERNYAGERKY